MKAIAEMWYKNDDTKTRIIPIEIESLKLELAQDALREKELLIFDEWLIHDLREPVRLDIKKK